MTIFLCIPPGSSLIPYPAVPYLVSALERAKCDVRVEDLGLRMLNTALAVQGYRIDPGVLYSHSAYAPDREQVLADHKEFASLLKTFELAAIDYAYGCLGIEPKGTVPNGSNLDTCQELWEPVWREALKWTEDVFEHAPQQTVIGFHAISLTGLLWSILLAGRIKSTRRDVLTVVGGPSVEEWDGVLAKWSSIDVVVHGEGEQALVEIAKCYSGDVESLAPIAGLTLRCANGDRICTGPRTLVEPLDAISMPDYACLPLRAGCLRIVGEDSNANAAERRTGCAEFGGKVT